MAKKQKEEKKSENKFYTVSDWRGYPNYECRHCAFKTLDRSDMTEHTERHIRGNPELAGLETPIEEELPAVDEDHGLTAYDQTEEVEEVKEEPILKEDTPPVERKETYKGPKKGKGKKGKK